VIFFGMFDALQSHHILAVNVFSSDGTAGTIPDCIKAVNVQVSQQEQSV
jgi:hypothetical protein